jgi:hypothetical protein
VTAHGEDEGGGVWRGEGSGFGHGKSQSPLPCFGMSKTESCVFMGFDGWGQRGTGH